MLGDGLPAGSAGHDAAELYSLVGRLASCGARVEEVLARLRDIQLLDWQSPAGQAYRDNVARQGTALLKAFGTLEEARIAVTNHAQERAALASVDDGWR
jgi:hypothetical protein